MSSPDFMPHQQKALDLTEGYNRVAIKGFEKLYEIEKRKCVFTHSR